jgi:hypothetical protein
MDKKKQNPKFRFNWPIGLAAISTIFTGLFVTFAWILSLDVVENIKIVLFGISPITFHPMWIPILLFTWGAVTVADNNRNLYPGEWFAKPAVTGCTMGLLYIAAGIVLIVTSEPLWLWAMPLINLVTVPIISLLKPKNQ